LGQACSGMMFVTGSEFPALIQIGVLDQATAITLSHAIITALLVRERQGISQEVHVSLLGTALWLQHINVMLSTVSRIDPCFSGDRTQQSPLRNVFCCKDNDWVMCTHHPEEKYWVRFCKVMGRSDLLDNPAYTNEKGAPINYAELNTLFDQIFLTRTRKAWMVDFWDNELMFAPIQRVMDVEKDTQALLNQYIVPCDYPGLGKVNIPGYPVHFSESQANIQTRAPHKGEHTDEILKDLGYAAVAVAELKKEGVVS